MKHAGATKIQRAPQDSVPRQNPTKRPHDSAPKCFARNRCPHHKDRCIVRPYECERVQNMRVCQVVLVGLLTWFGTVSVRADVAPPPSCGSTSSSDIAACSGKMAGDSCTFASGTKGNCASLRCVTDAGTTQLACVATGASSPGCSFSGTVEGGAALGMLLLGSLAVAVLRRRERQP